MRLSKLIEFLLQVEREDGDDRPVVIDILPSHKVIGIKEENDQVVVKTKEKEDG